MNLRRAKTIDQLYEEVRDYDFVVCCDAALVTALNAKIDHSTLDGFAFTPKMLASMIQSAVLQTRPLSDLELVEWIQDETGLDFRYVHSEIENIRDIRRYTENVGKYLYSKRAAEVLERYNECPTTEKVMSIFDSSIYTYNLTGKRVAVIGLDLFNDLDKHMLPQSFDEIDPFTDGDFEIGTIHGIGNDRQIAGNIAELIEPETANDTAIILDPNSAVADAIKSALYKRHIPFKNDLVVKDLAQVRDYIQFITLALDFDTIRVRDVRELFSVYQKGRNVKDHYELSFTQDNYLLHKIQVTDRLEPVTAMMIGMMKDIRDLTFSYVAEKLYENMPQLTSVMMLLKDMHLESERITADLVGKLTYAVNNVSDIKHNEQVPDYEKHGVLLADCCNSVYVDRSLVIFVGLDDSWEVTAPGKDYVDKEQLDKDSAYRMSILLQQGTTRIYAVKPASGGKNTVPCTTFQTIWKEMGTPKNISSFRDICSEYRVGSWYSPSGETLAKPQITVPESPDIFSRISKTKYNTYRQCPIEFMFSLILKTEETDSLVFGNQLHHLAEYYFSYPEEVREKGLDYYLTRMEEEYAGLSNECQKPFDVSRFRVYAKNMMRYIDSIRPPEVSLDAPVAKDNPIFIQEGKTHRSSLTEYYLESSEPTFAKFDVCVGNFIVDYKTGKPKTSKEVIKGFDDSGRTADFQAPIYLKVLSEHTGGECRFDLVFLGENDVESVSDSYDIGRSVRTIILSESNKLDLALAPDGPLKAYVDITKSQAKFMNNWDAVAPVLRQFMEMGNQDSDACISALISAAGMNDTDTNRKAAVSLSKKATAAVQAKYLVDANDRVLIPADTMAEFVGRFRKDHESIKSEYRLPIYNLKKGKADCDYCPFNKLCLRANGEEEEEE